MSRQELPPRPNLEQYRKQAKDLNRAFQTEQSEKVRDAEALRRVRACHPRFAGLTDEEALRTKFALADAQLVIAREHGFESWPKFAQHVASAEHARAAAAVSDPVKAFIEAACVPRDAAHTSGRIERAEAILAVHPNVAESSVYTAAVLGNVHVVRRLLAQDERNATAKGGPHGWDALTYLCFSNYLRLDPARSDGFIGAARALLDAGANPNTGWMETNHQPDPEWESVIYGAAGIAHHAELTKLLLERGAEPNDGETPYHAPESYDNAALKVLVESGKLNDTSLATMLLRKADWHDTDGIRWLLARGADPNRMTKWGRTAFHNAVLSDNSLEIIEALLEHGANPAIIAERPDRWQDGQPGKSGIAMAVRRGRGDVLERMEGRGIAIELQGVERLIAACARGNVDQARVILEQEPELGRELLAQGGKLLAEFAGVGNTEGVRILLDLGVDVAALHTEGDPYFDLAKNSTALHAAAWRARPATVKLLLERGAPFNALDGKGRTALMLAVRACVDSYWTAWRTPESVAALLQAGATVRGAEFPSGYAEVDELLRAHGAGRSE